MSASVIDKDRVEAAPGTPTARPRTVTGKPQLAYIDCLRGYAVLMVMICHTTYALPQLPYPVHRLGAFGWHGVQLFFLASCITLMMSAHHEIVHSGRMSIKNFFIRRFLRISPMYYVSAGIYWIIDPHAGADIGQLMASFLFVNAWHPVTTTTTGAWQVVPGGWSIGVEFTFYFLFPFFVATIRSLHLAGLAFAGSLFVGALFNSLLTPLISARYGATPTDNFLYFWFFNQAPVFALGALTYFAIQLLQDRQDWLWTRLIERHVDAWLAASLVGLLLVAMAPIPFSHELMLKATVPQFIAASLVFAIFIIAMSKAQRSILINPLAAGLGKVSFSAYLLHFAVISLVLERHPKMFHLNATGWTAIIAFGCDVMVVVIITYLASAITHALIEEPGIKLAKRLSTRPTALSQGAAI